MSSLTPLSPFTTTLPSALADPASRPQTLPVQSSSAPTVAVPPNAVQPVGSPASGQDSRAADDDLNEAVEKVSKAVAAYSSELQFSIDEESGTQVVKVIDRQTDQVIRQFPSEEMLKIAKSLDKVLGVLIEQKA
ncbi:MAG: flagellar protein FlaG [Pseudogulbenkiania sp.]|nr:flagellar protein FlaG [Pseudogulbenkiania sp.]